MRGVVVHLSVSNSECVCVCVLYNLRLITFNCILKWGIYFGPILCMCLNCRCDSVLYLLLGLILCCCCGLWLRVVLV